MCRRHAGRRRPKRERSLVWIRFSPEIRTVLWEKRSQKFTAETKNEKRSNEENGKAAPKFLHGSVQTAWLSSVHKQTVPPAEEQIRKGDIQPEKNGADGDSKQPGPESADLCAV